MNNSQYAILPFEVMASKLSPSSKVVYCCLSMLNNKEKGCCWPSNEKIVEYTRLSLTTVKVCLTELEKKGFIRRDTTFSDDSFKKERKIYLLALPS